MSRTPFPSLIESLETRRLLAALTDIDASFGTNGRALLDHFNVSTDYVDAVALTPSNKLLIGGSSDVVADAKATLARYNLDGTPDATFGAGGKLRLTSGSGFADLIVNSNETITTLSSSTAGGVPYMRRFTAIGGNDSSFSFGVTGLSGTPMDLDQTTTGKFYLVTGNHIARVNANGSADTGFGTSGRVTIAQEPNFIQFNPQRVAAMADGGVVVAGRYGSAVNGERRAALRRFTSTGALDTTFGTNGTFTIPGFSADTWIDKLTLLPDGKLLMLFRDNFSAGNTISYVAKLNPGGTLDTTFNGDGITSLTGPSAVYTEAIGDLVLDSTGRMYGIGFVQGTSVDDAPSFIFRLLANGNIDTSFATNGYNQTFFPAGQFNWGEPRVVLPGNGSLYHVTSNRTFTSGTNQDQLIFKFSEATGAHDTGFGPDGHVAIGFNASLSQSMLGSDLLSDGGVAFAGYPPSVSNGQMIVGRLTASGQPAVFGPNGTGTTEVSFGTTSSLAFDVVGQPDGKLVVGGRATTFNGTTFLDDYALARLNADGTFDTSFGTGGKVVLGYSGVNFEQITRVALAADGKILALGVHQIVGTGGERRGAILRFNPNGTLDNTFGDGGRLLLNQDDFLNEIIPLADGSILLGGERENHSTAPFDDALIIRLLSDGTIDSSFGTGGEIQFDFNDDDNSLIALDVDSTGRLYAASWDSSTSNGELQLRRYSVAGVLDTTFGNGGFINHAFPTNTNAPSDMKITAAGKLLAFGPTRNSPRDVYLMSFLPSGDLDTTFGTNGRQQYDVQGSDTASELHIGADGRWTLTGSATGATTLGDFSALRVMGTDQPPDTTAPTVAGVFKYATGHVIELNFSEHVTGPAPEDLTLTRLDAPVTVAIPADWLSYNPEAQRLRITPDAPLADGNYRLTVAAGSATDTNGNSLAADYTLDFFVLAADANGDRRVNSTDQAILNNNFGQSNRTAQQGDFDFNGTVNELDQAILDSSLNVWLPAQGSIVALPVELFAATFRLRRESTRLLAAWDNTAGTGAPKYRIVIGAVGGVTLTSFGPDVLVADFSNGPLLDTGRVDFNGSGGSDTLLLIGSAAADQVTFDAADAVVSGGVVRRSSVENVTFDGQGGWDSLSISGSQPVTITGPQELQDLTIGTGATAIVAAGAGATLVTRDLSIETNGKLNLADNDLLWDYTGETPYETLLSYMLAGRDTAASGILFTDAGNTILAIADNVEWGELLFNDIPIDDSALVGKYTYYGDANLDGAVTSDDYVAVDVNLGVGNGTRQWIHGDFDFDRNVTSDDYVAIDVNLGSGAGDPLAVAEPSSIVTDVEHEADRGRRAHGNGRDHRETPRVERKPRG